MRLISRKDLAKHLRLSTRYIDELTKTGVLPFFKIGKSVRYDLTEVEAAMRERFYVQAQQVESRRRAKSERKNCIDGVRFSTLVHGGLDNAGIKTMRQLASLSDAQIMRFRRIGKKGLAEIKAAVEAYKAGD